MPSARSKLSRPNLTGHTIEFKSSASPQTCSRTKNKLTPQYLILINQINVQSQIAGECRRDYIFRMCRHDRLNLSPALMWVVAQFAEHRTVTAAVEGSSPFDPPKFAELWPRGEALGCQPSR
jgi:hypothetical protein